MDILTEAFSQVDAGVQDAPEADGSDETVDLQSVAEGSATDDGHASGEDASAATEQDSEEADPSASKAADDPFADLKTAAGITKAREAIEQQRAELTKRQRGFDRAFTKLEAGKKELESARQRFQAEQGPARQAAQRFLEDLAVVHPSSTASVKERFLAMGRMAGRDPREFYEELSMGMLKDGPAEGAPTAAEKRLKAEIEQLRQERLAEKQRAEEEKERALALAVQQRKARAVTEAASAITAEAYPELYAAAGGKPKLLQHIGKKAVEKQISHYQETGQKLDTAGALAKLEAALRKAKGTETSQPRTGSAAPPTSRGGRAGASQKTGTVKPIGRTVTSTVADTSTGGKKTLTQDERREKNLQDPDFRLLFRGLLG